MGAGSSLYGTTYEEGGNSGGLVFKLDPNGKETVLHTFGIGTANDGAYPTSGVTLDKAGNLYGMTTQGGNSSYPYGTVYKVNTKDHESVLHRFSLLPDGQEPNGGVLLDAAGNIYGTTTYGGGGGANGEFGMVFKIDPRGKETILHNFKGYLDADGEWPYAALVMDRHGNLYGRPISAASTAMVPYSSSRQVGTRPSCIASPAAATAPVPTSAA